MTDKRIKSYLEDRLKRLESIRNEREWTTAELGDIACCKQTLAFINSLQEEPVSVWHDASEEPKSDKDIAVVTKEGFMWSRYKIEDLGRGWKQFVNDAEIDKWAYISDLINL